ncbi:hypothetical protein NP233_g3663 [Leucocoprinus birnbaumii]|uniref:Uncharacterized protein n=1 Tax=Leucocoprinus birnbaumii TaxID=56174 RepID=A0AAD5VYS2_9AGAR|nr:hypothetical protein NP233_g3663 [Leucocoprinus birnbaumii]
MHLASDDQNTLLGAVPILQATRNTVLAASPQPPPCPPTNHIDSSLEQHLQDFQLYYSSDIYSFRPTYFATADGSLITPALTDDLWDANLDLVFTAALAMLFIRNIAVAIDYLRRGKNKNKTLLYLLFVGQALAPASFIPLILSFFDQFVDCTLVVKMASTVGSVALAILLSGIIGLKTYRCMNDSKIIAGLIGTLGLGHLAIVALDAAFMQGARRISGSCLRTSDLFYTRIAVAILMGECCFMTLCFVYTAIKYRKTPGARGRISLRMSTEEDIPDLTPTETGHETTLDANQFREADEKATSNIPPRSSALRISSELPVTHPDDGRSHARKSMASSFSRLSRLLSNMTNLKKVMRDELLYTCVITVVITIALVFTFTGVNVKNGLSVTSWIFLTWGLVSVFVIHSAGRVVRRQERHSLVRYAAARGSRATFATPKFAKANDFWISTHTPIQRSRRDSAQSKNTQVSDPFSERHQLRQERRPSYQSGVTSSMPSPLSPEMKIENLSNSGALPLPAEGSGLHTPTPVVAPLESESIRSHAYYLPRSENTGFPPTSMMDFNEATDELVAVLPIHFTNTLIPNVQLHQFPLLNRPLQVPPSAQLSGKRIAARIKPEVRRIEIHVPADTRPDVWNGEKSRELGAAQIEDDIEKKQERKKLKEGEEARLGEIRLQSEKLPQRGVQMLGIVRNGKLNLHPISEAHQFRPTLTHLDILSRRNRRGRQGGSDSDSDDGPPPDPDDPAPLEVPKKEKKSVGPGKEVQVSARKSDDKGGASALGGLSAVRRDMLRIIRLEEDEEWDDLRFFDTSAEESAETFEAIFSQSTGLLEMKDDVTQFLEGIKGLKPKAET